MLNSFGIPDRQVATRARPPRHQQNSGFMRLGLDLPPRSCNAIWTQAPSGRRLYGSNAVSSVRLSPGCKEKQETPEASPPEVEVTEVVQRNVPVYHEWVAQLNGRTNAEITPRVQGYLLEQNYRNGFFVKKGQLLYEIDPRAFEAAIGQAKAQVAAAVANLSDAEPTLRATSRSRRRAPFRKSNSIPISRPRPRIGRIGRSQSTAGTGAAESGLDQSLLAHRRHRRAFHGPNREPGGTTTIMTTVSQVNPIWAYFNISESDYLTEAPEPGSVLQR